MSELVKCGACGEVFGWDEHVVKTGDRVFHDECVELYPIGYFIMLDDEPIGESENEPGQEAYEILEEGQYIDMEV